jgi:hypothetical protein
MVLTFFCEATTQLGTAVDQSSSRRVALPAEATSRVDWYQKTWFYIITALRTSSLAAVGWLRINFTFKWLRLYLILKTVFTTAHFLTVFWAIPHSNISFSTMNFNNIPLMLCMGVAEIAYSLVTHYELDGPRIGFWGVRFSVPSRPAPWSAQSPAHWAWIFPMRKEPGALSWPPGCECVGAIPLPHRCTWIVVSWDDLCLLSTPGSL